MEHTVWFYFTIFQSMLSNMAVDQNYFIRIFGVDGSQNQIDTWARRCAYLWLYNPLVMTVSARGNAESIVVTLVLATLHLYQVRTISHSCSSKYFQAYMKRSNVSQCWKLNLIISFCDFRRGCSFWLGSLLGWQFTSKYTQSFLHYHFIRP